MRFIRNAWRSLLESRSPTALAFPRVWIVLLRSATLGSAVLAVKATEAGAQDYYLKALETFPRDTLDVESWTVGSERRAP